MARASKRSPSPTRRPKLRIGFVLLDEFTLAAFAGLVDVLRLSADSGGASRQIDASWTVMSLNGEPRRSSCGVVLSSLEPLRRPRDFDYVAVCGGNDYRRVHQPSALME